MPIPLDQGIKILVVINAATLVAIMFYGYKIIRFFSRIELKTDLMWDDYVARTGYAHKRRTDK